MFVKESQKTLFNADKSVSRVFDIVKSCSEYTFQITIDGRKVRRNYYKFKNGTKKWGLFYLEWEYTAQGSTPRSYTLVTPDGVDAVTDPTFRVGKKYGFLVQGLSGVIYDKISELLALRYYAILNNGKWGIADRCGNVIVECIMDECPQVWEEINSVYIDGEQIKINEDGSKFGFTDNIRYEDFEQCDLAAIQINGKWGYVNQLKEVVVKPIFEEALMFCDKYAAVKLDGKWGYIDYNGAFALYPGYDSVESTNYWPDKYITVTNNGKFGALNDKFEEIISPQYDEIGDFVYGVAPVRCEDKWGAVNNCGEIFIPVIYAKTKPAPNGGVFVAIDCNNGTLSWGMADKAGQLIIPIEYLDIVHFHADLICCKKADGQSVLYTLDGEVLTKGNLKFNSSDPSVFKYGAISSHSNGKTTQICVFSLNYNNGLVYGIKGVFSNWMLSPNGHLWVEDENRHITIYNEKGETVCQKDDMHIMRSTYTLLQGGGISSKDYLVIACENRDGHLVIFSDDGREIYNWSEKYELQELYIGENSHILLCLKKGNFVVSLKHNKRFKVNSIMKVYVINENHIGYIDSYIYSWSQQTKYCNKKGCNVLYSNDFVIGYILGSNEYTLITAGGKLLLQTIAKSIEPYNGCCIVDYNARCDIYTPDGEFVPMYGFHPCEDCVDFEYGVVTLKSDDGKISLVNTAGDILLTLSPNINNIAAPRGNLIPVRDKESMLWGFIDRQGNLVIDYKYSAIVPRNMERKLKCLYGTSCAQILFEGKEGIRRIFERDKGCTIIGDNCNEIIPLMKGFISEVTNGYYALSFIGDKNIKDGYIIAHIENDNVVYSEKFDHISWLYRKGYIDYSTQRGNKYGLLDPQTCNSLLPTIFDVADVLPSRLIRVKINNKYYTYAPDLSLTCKYNFSIDSEPIFEEN